jgi:hypothetical protein
MKLARNSETAMAKPGVGREISVNFMRYTSSPTASPFSITVAEEGKAGIIRSLIDLIRPLIRPLSIICAR